MGAVDFSIDMRLVRALQEVVPLDVFVETGTFEGETTGRARESFEEIHSIELSDYYYAQAAKQFADDSAVRLHHGESSDVLGSLRAALKGKSVLYWLDAHWCVADETAGGRSQCPLLEELAAIKSLNVQSVVLIDDARLFLATPPYPHEASSWPRLQEVVQGLLRLSPHHELMVVNDVIIFFPSAALTAVSGYARSCGTDWLVHFHQLAEFEKAALERLEAVEALAVECDLQEKAARERLAVIEELTIERDVQAKAARERLAVIEELTIERDVQAKAARERLTLIEGLTASLEDRQISGSTSRSEGGGSAASSASLDER